MIRYTAYRAFGNIIQFCCKKCDRGYFDERRKEAQSPPRSLFEVTPTSPPFIIVRIPPSAPPSGAAIKVKPYGCCATLTPLAAVA